MSSGLVCECGIGTHPPSSQAPGCGRYAADQELGGFCSSCATGWHRPCDRPRFSPGACNVCGWHGMQHPEAIR